jgi:hypothetical protein
LRWFYLSSTELRQKNEMKVGRFVLVAILIAALAQSASARPAQRQYLSKADGDASRAAQTTRDDGRQHCGQRAFSVSVGNPAFKDRLDLWPLPCRW